MLAPLPLTLTCIQQLLHHLKVGVRHAVVQRRVPVAVCHVDDVAQHGQRDGPEGPQVVLHHGRHRRLLAGHTKPLVLHRVQTGSLRRQEGGGGLVSGDTQFHETSVLDIVKCYSFSCMQYQTQYITVSGATK